VQRDAGLLKDALRGFVESQSLEGSGPGPDGQGCSGVEQALDAFLETQVCGKGLSRPGRAFRIGRRLGAGYQQAFQLLSNLFHE
jgi:hypothetical protein